MSYSDDDFEIDYGESQPKETPKPAVSKIEEVKTAPAPIKKPEPKKQEQKPTVTPSKTQDKHKNADYDHLHIEESKEVTEVSSVAQHMEKIISEDQPKAPLYYFLMNNICLAMNASNGSMFTYTNSQEIYSNSAASAVY